MPPTLTRRPQATAFSIEDLMDKVQRGEVRIPSFQRPLKWTSEDIRALFDSVYRGYPIGTLLFWKREASAASLHYGPAHIDAPSSAQALWVVDGQQRISSLTSVLLRKGTVDMRGLDDFSIFFDLETAELIRPTDEQSIQAHWLPLNVTLDSEHLLEWLDGYPGRTQHPEHTKAAIRFGKAIREFQLPAYIVDADEEQTLRIIFKRLNTSGKPLTQEEVFNALYGSTSGSRPLDLQSMSRTLQDLDFGRLEQGFLVQAVLAVQGLDFTQDFQTQLREDDDLTANMLETDKALRDAIIFTKRDIGIPHINILPYEHHPLLALARFFHLHPNPTARSRELLARWAWRVLFNGQLGIATASPITDLNAIGLDEEGSIQRLLASAGKPNASIPSLITQALDTIPTSTNRAIYFWFETRLWVFLTLLDAHPRNLLDGSPLDVTTLINEQGWHVLRSIFPIDNSGQRRSPLNRIIHPKLQAPSILEILRSEQPLDSRILSSHLITPEARFAIQRGDEDKFFILRAEAFLTQLDSFLRAKTRWDESDRPSIQSLVISDEED
ncbi:DUF262 domain-containing protein [Corallococcus terminator]